MSTTVNVTNIFNCGSCCTAPCACAPQKFLAPGEAPEPAPVLKRADKVVVGDRLILQDYGDGGSPFKVTAKRQGKPYGEAGGEWVTLTIPDRKVGACVQFLPDAQVAVVPRKPDFTPHPDVLLGGSLERIDAAHESGDLARILHIGSQWHYGPVYENMETVVEVIAPPRRSRDLVNYSQQPGDKGVAGKKSIHVKCRVLSSPHRAYPAGHEVSLPPCALVPREAVLRERGLGCGCCSRPFAACAPRDWRDERIDALENEVAVLAREKASADRRARTAEKKLDRIKSAL